MSGDTQEFEDLMFPHLAAVTIWLSQSSVASEGRNYGDVTVSVVWAITLHEIACMVVVPAPTRLANPLVPEVKAATAGLVDDQVTELVMSLPPWSLAVNCSVFVPNEIVWLRGLIVMAVMTPQTVMLAVPEIPWEVAVMVAGTGATPVTRPVLELTDAILIADDDQLAATLPVLPSLKVPLATICRVEPTLTKELPLLAPTVMVVSVGFVKNPLQPATSRNTTVAKANHTRPARL